MWRVIQVRRPRRMMIVIVFITSVFFLLKYYDTEPVLYTQTESAVYDNGNLVRGHDSQVGTGIQHGKANLDIWKDMCTLSFNSLRQHPFFPCHPNVRSYLEIGDSFKINVEGKKLSALRVVGYLHPPASGNYSFYLNSFFMAQFWLSTNGPQNANKLAYTTRNKLHEFVYFVGNPLPKSEKIFLINGKKYYFEILKVLNSGVANGKTVSETRLEWMLPGQTFFTNIDGRYFSTYFNVSGNFSTCSNFEKISPSLVISDKEDQSVGPFFPPNQRAKINFKHFNRENVRGLSYLERQFSLKAFPKCRYISRFMEKKQYSRWSGAFTVSYPKVYPDDGSGSVRFTNVWKAFDGDDRHNGSTFMNKTEAESVAASFMGGFDKGFPRSFELVDIVHMEKVHDNERGDRFLLDLVLNRRHDNRPLRVSEFMYRNKSQNELCILEDLDWNPKVWINVILNAKNQAAWVVHFIKDVSRVMKETGDQYINVIVVDYGNNGLDIGQELQRYGIENYEVINQTGVFHKTASINLAASRVKDPNSIVLLMDLHLQLSLDFFDKIRKHTFQGILAFAPILFRLDSCGRPRTKHLCPSGYWESLGFGIFGIYKSDWDNFGGMNVKEFTNKWGGEDWEMVDRVLSSGIEIDKQRVPGFYHFYHEKKGMWNN